MSYFSEQERGTAHFPWSLFLQLQHILEKFAFPVILLIVQWKMIITNQVLQIKSSLSVKTIETELWTNNPPSLKGRLSCAAQNGKKLLHNNSATFDAKKTKEILRTRLSGNTII